MRQGVYLGQFSFATPKPLQEDYIRKRKYPARTRELPEILEPVEGVLIQSAVVLALSALQFINIFLSFP